MTTNMQVDLGKTSKTKPYGRGYQNHREEEGSKEAGKKCIKTTVQVIVYHTRIIIIDFHVSVDD